MTLRDRLRAALVRGTIIHRYDNPAETPRALVELIDRFLDDSPRYPLEWDDFISWKKENATVERARLEICQWERLLFSRSRANMLTYCNHLVDVRNRVAAMVDVPPREPVSQWWARDSSAEVEFAGREVVGGVGAICMGLAAPLGLLFWLSRRRGGAPDEIVGWVILGLFFATALALGAVMAWMRLSRAKGGRRDHRRPLDVEDL